MIDKQLKRQKSVNVPFHLYYLPQSDENDVDLKKLQKKIIELMLSGIKENLT